MWSGVMLQLPSTRVIVEVGGCQDVEVELIVDGRENCPQYVFCCLYHLSSSRIKERIQGNRARHPLESSTFPTSQEKKKRVGKEMKSHDSRNRTGILLAKAVNPTAGCTRDR